MANNWRFLVVAVLLTAACSADDSWSSHEQELAQSGRWAPPGEVVALADGYNIRNVQAGPWVGTDGCGGSLLEGSRVLREWITAYWPQVKSVGGYSCRRIAGTNTMSVHGTGRALDIMLPIDSTQPYEASADNELGDPLANWLLEHADELGIQLIIWDRKIWSSGRSPGERLYNYGGVHPHHDHIHMELNPEAAALGTPWFKGPMGPPDLGPCGEPIGPEGGVVDDSDECFNAFGPAEYWRVVDGAGVDGSLRWTNAFKSDNPSNWARWRLELAEAGRYRVEYNSVADYAAFDSAHYRIRHAGVEEDIYVDLAAGGPGWQTLGEFDFAAGADQWVAVYDNSPVDVAEQQHVIADAIRLVVPSAEPEPVEPTEPTDPPVTEPPVEPEMGEPLPPKTPVDEHDTEPTYDDHDHDLDYPTVVDGRGGCSTTGASPTLLTFVFLFALGLFKRRATALRARR